MTTRTTYRLCHRWMRKLLAAGHPIPIKPPAQAGPAWHAARAALSHRTPAHHQSTTERTTP